MQQTKMTQEQAKRRLNAVLECVQPPTETILELVRLLEEHAVKAEQRAA